MVRINFYENKVSREHRPANKGVLNVIRPSRVLDVDGCDITNTSTFVDLETPTDRDWTNLLYSTSYISITNNNGSVYYCFVDRVEPNNFNGNINYYRLYFTIDWWTTLLYRFTEEEFNEVVREIDGNIERAHVNDVFKSGNSFYPTLNYTTDIAEEQYNEVYSSGFMMKNDNGKSPASFDRVQWCYVLFNFRNDPSEIFSIFTSGEISLGFNRSVAPCGVACFPIVGGDTLEFRIQYKNANDDWESVTYSGGIPLSMLQDSRIIHMFISTIPPSPYACIADSTVPYGFYVYTETRKNGDPLTYLNLGETLLEFPNSWQPIYGQYKEFPIFSVYEGYTLDFAEYINSGRYNLPYKIIYSSEVINKPSSYSDYHSLAIKARSEAYNKSYIYCNNVAEPLAVSRANAFTCSIDYENGGIFLKCYKDNDATAYGTNKRVGVDSTFSQFKKIDQLKMFQGVISTGFGSSSNVFSGYNGKKEVNPFNVVGGYIGGVGNAITGMMDMISAGRGATSSQPFGQGEENGIGLPQLIIQQPVNLTPIIDRLEMYGYNTLLTFPVIINSHKRKYFNHIKMNNCKILTPCLCTEAKLQIEEMFNNGVWLWNNVNAPAEDCEDGKARFNAMGYLWLNNYPSIMDN